MRAKAVSKTEGGKRSFGWGFARPKPAAVQGVVKESKAGDHALILRAQADGGASADAKAAMAELWERHSGFIVLCIKRGLGLRGDAEMNRGRIDAMMGAAGIAFVRAVRAWKPNKNANLLTFAGIGIQGEIWKALDADKLIHVPRGQALKAGTFKDDVERSQRVARLDRVVGRGERSTRLAELVPIAKSEATGGVGGIVVAVAAADEQAFEVAAVQCAVSLLPEPMRTVMRERIAGKTLKTIGEKVGLTRERVRQIEAIGIGRIAAAFGVKRGWWTVALEKQQAMARKYQRIQRDRKRAERAAARVTAAPLQTSGGRGRPPHGDTDMLSAFEVHMREAAAKLDEAYARVRMPVKVELNWPEMPASPGNARCSAARWIARQQRGDLVLMRRQGVLYLRKIGEPVPGRVAGAASPCVSNGGAAA